MNKAHIELLARALCMDAGYEPDGETFGSFPAWYEYEVEAESMLSAILRGHTARAALAEILREVGV